MKKNIVQQHLSEIKRLMEQHGVKSAYAFGSIVKGNDNKDSDVDFLIKFDENSDYETYANNYFSLLHALKKLLNKDVDLLAEETITNPYLRQSIDLHKIQVFMNLEEKNCLQIY